MTTPADEIEKAQERLAALVTSGDPEALVEALEELHPSDIADLVEELEDDHQVRVLSVLPPEVASETLAEMEEGEDRGDLLAALDPAKGAELLQELADDDAADLLGELEPHEQHRIFEELSEEDAGDIRGLLLYGEETAGGLMTTELVAVEASLTAAQGLGEVRRLAQEVGEFYTVFVVDERQRLLGSVGLNALVTAEPHEKVEALVQPVLASVLPSTDQEEVGRLMARYNLVAMAVVNEFGVLLGRITFDDVLDVIEAEQTEDILRMAGAGAGVDALRYTWWESVRARLPWLVVNLGTASLAASVVYYHSRTIEDTVILASVMPIVAGMGGNAGTQALAVTVRSIALEGGPGRQGGKAVGRELLVGAVHGALLGALVAVLAGLVGGDPLLGLVVFLAMWGNLIVAGFLGSFVPTVLSRLGIDPAVGSSMFVTPFTDLCGFFLLLTLASRILL
ncbi:MAG: magnesium transporter [Gemmatimonadetes bacterium]|nr:magnesium transporter [Gemmatimonadota bacterium]